MKSGNHTITIIAILLIIVQIVSFVGMSRMYVGLYPDGDNLIYSSYSRNSRLNIKMILFAITAGLDRFKSSFTDLFFSKYEYRVMTSEQMTSAMIRDSLGASANKSFGLIVYDTILTVTYCSVGIVGLSLLSISTIKRKNKRTNYNPHPEYTRPDSSVSNSSDPPGKQFL